MAKKEKIPMTPEERAAKKLKSKKGWARFFAIVLAVAITGGVFAIGSKGGHKIVKEEEPAPVVVQQVVQPVQTPTQPAPVVTPTTAAPTTKAPTTAAPTTKAPTTTAPSGDSSGGGILDSIMGLLGGFDIGSLLGGGGDALGGLGGLVDRNGAADTIEGAGDKAKDFFYGLADNVEENQGLDGISSQIGDTLSGIGGGSGDSGSGGIDLGGLTDSLGGLGDSLGGLGDMLGGLGGLLG